MPQSAPHTTWLCILLGQGRPDRFWPPTRKSTGLIVWTALRFQVITDTRMASLIIKIVLTTKADMVANELGYRFVFLPVPPSRQTDPVILRHRRPNCEGLSLYTRAHTSSSEEARKPRCNYWLGSQRAFTNWTVCVLLIRRQGRPLFHVVQRHWWRTTRPAVFLR